MEDRPNLDYEPGPRRASFSRIGPPAPRREPFHYEVAEELVPGSASKVRKRASRRRFSGKPS
jgi:hypothetical protein